MRTVLRGLPIGGKGDTTTGTDARAVRLHRSVTAVLRAVLDRAMNGLSGVELLTAMGACRRTAGVTNSGRARSRYELLLAGTADLDGVDNRERRSVCKFGMSRPKCVFGYAVTRFAERDQVVESVRFSVVVKQPERSNVMNRKVWRDNSAMLTGIVIAPVGESSLSIPVRPAMFCTSSAPTGAISTDPVFGRTPLPEASAAAKVELSNRARWLLNILAAGSTLNDHSLPAKADPVRLLPFAIAGETAKVPFRLGGHVRLGVVGLTALFAREFDHSSIIR